MRWSESEILAVLDNCAEAFTFPVLDNGYVYPAATRLTAYSSALDWAVVIEVFGFSPRAGLPDTALYCFSSNVQRQRSERNFINRQAYERYIGSNRFNEMSTVFPVMEGDWQDDDAELVAELGSAIAIRDHSLALPSPETYTANGISLERAPRVQVFELCRALALSQRDSLLATPQERRASVPSGCVELLMLDEWHHPDIAGGELPSSCGSFVQLAEVLVSGDRHLYRPSVAANTHWRNWPEGGLL